MQSNYTMDSNTQYSFLTYTKDTLPPAQLFIGQHDHAVEMAEQQLQRMLCLNNSCNTCIPCMQIRNKQHHAIMWLYPEKNYTLDQFNDLFAALSFQLQPNELFFFVIQKAEFLTPACANKLLKPMEEPPAGYHFILLAEHAEQIVPTIRSRCITHLLATQSTSKNLHPLVEVFTKKEFASNEFTKILDTANINERESIELFDQILSYWLTEYQREKTPEIMSIVYRLQKAQLQPPMPGSSTTFWRNIYLSLQNK